MNDAYEPLRSLLRAQLTAVNQQYVHMLALRVWGETEMADRIGRVDKADSQASMKIMDHLVAEGAPLNLAFDAIAPGDAPAAVCAAELSMERRIGEHLAGPAPSAIEGWLGPVQAPRDGYVAWLDERASAAKCSRGSVDEPIDVLFAELIALIEQTTAHAFIHRHRGDSEDADVAWAVSGVAMASAGVITRAVARDGRTPNAPDVAALSISEAPSTASANDRARAACCADAAAEAARATDGELARRCAFVEAFARQVADHDGGEAVHPAIALAGPNFRSFAAAMERHIGPTSS